MSSGQYLTFFFHFKEIQDLGKLKSKVMIQVEESISAHHDLVQTRRSIIQGIGDESQVKPILETHFQREPSQNLVLGSLSLLVEAWSHGQG